MVTTGNGPPLRHDWTLKSGRSHPDHDPRAGIQVSKSIILCERSPHSGLRLRDPTGPCGPDGSLGRS
eukprot:4262187-Prymnesium_polylepis.1